MRHLYIKGKLKGIISIGGTTGTQIGTKIMRSLPFGVLTLAVSSTASLSGFASRNIATADIALMHSVVEIAGVNNLVRDVLTRAAGPTRLEAAGKMGIPQIIAPCGVTGAAREKKDYKPEYNVRPSSNQYWAVGAICGIVENGALVVFDSLKQTNTPLIALAQFQHSGYAVSLQGNILKKRGLLSFRVTQTVWVIEQWGSY